MKLNQEQRDARVQSARKHAIANWAGRTTAVSVSISQATADKFGLESGDGDGYLEQKTDTKGNKADGLEMVNGNCPQADSIEELEDLCELLKTDLLKLRISKRGTEPLEPRRRKQESHEAGTGQRDSGKDGFWRVDRRTGTCPDCQPHIADSGYCKPDASTGLACDSGC
jgi:hypothetical protein